MTHVTHAGRGQHVTHAGRGRSAEQLGGVACRTVEMEPLKECGRAFV